MVASTLRKARAALDAGDLSRARDLAQAVLVRFPGNPEAREIAGECWRRDAYALLGSQRVDEAARAFAQARALQPADARLANDHGVLFGTLPPGTRADAIVERAIPTV